MKSETLSFDTSNGDSSAYVAIPDNATRKAVVVKSAQVNLAASASRCDRTMEGNRSRLANPDG